MMASDVEQQVVSLVRNVKKDIAVDGFGRTTPLAELGIDSLDALNILFAIEEHFGVAISDERAREIRTFGDVIDTVMALAPPRS